MSGKGIKELKKPKIVETKNSEVMRAEKRIKGVSLSFELIKSSDAYNSVFLVKSIFRKGKEIWSFKKDKPTGFKGLARLCGFGEELYIILDYFGIVKVIPLIDVMFQKKSDDLKLLKLKFEIARNLKMKVILSEQDEAIVKANAMFFIFEQ